MTKTPRGPISGFLWRVAPAILDAHTGNFLDRLCKKPHEHAVAWMANCLWEEYDPTYEADSVDNVVRQDYARYLALCAADIGV